MSLTAVPGGQEAMNCPAPYPARDMTCSPLSGGGADTVKAAVTGGAACLPEFDSGAGPAVQPGQWPRRTALELAALATAVPCARLHARNVVLEWSLAELAETVELIVSEIVTNAVRASGSLGSPDRTGASGLPTVRLWLNGSQSQVLVQVWDGNDWQPQQREPGLDAEG